MSQHVGTVLWTWFERFLEQQPAVTAALLSPAVREKEKEISAFTESDISNLEDFMQTLKPVKVATCVMSDETHPTLSVIAPLHAQLLQASPFARELKEAIHQDLLKRSEVEEATLDLASALDPRFKLVLFLPDEEKQKTPARLVAEAAATLANHDQVIKYRCYNINTQRKI